MITPSNNLVTVSSFSQLRNLQIQEGNKKIFVSVIVIITLRNVT